MHEALVPVFPDRLYTFRSRGTHSNITHKQVHLLGICSSYDGPTLDSQRALRLADWTLSLPVGRVGKGERAEVFWPIPSC